MPPAPIALDDLVALPDRDAEERDLHRVESGSLAGPPFSGVARKKEGSSRSFTVARQRTAGPRRSLPAQRRGCERVLLDRAPAERCSTRIRSMTGTVTEWYQVPSG